MYKLFSLLVGLLLFALNAVAAVNVNTANKTELTSLPGIGPAKAQAIIDYRTKNGPFKSVDDLTKVNGIGPVILGRIRSDVALDGPTTVKPAANSTAAKPAATPAAKPATSATATPAAAAGATAVAGSAVSKPAPAAPASSTDGAAKSEPAKPATMSKEEKKAADKAEKEKKEAAKKAEKEQKAAAKKAEKETKETAKKDGEQK
jgi:competence protein ComEA